MLVLIPSLIALLQATPSPSPSAAASPAASPLGASPAPSASPCAGHDRKAHAQFGGGGPVSLTGTGYGDGGITRVAVWVDENGDIQNAVVYSGSGNPQMDKQALADAESGTYSAAIKNCKTIKSVIIVTPDG